MNSNEMLCGSKELNFLSWILYKILLGRVKYNCNMGSDQRKVRFNGYIENERNRSAAVLRAGFSRHFRPSQLIARIHLR